MQFRRHRFFCALRALGAAFTALGLAVCAPATSIADLEAPNPEPSSSHAPEVVHARPGADAVSEHVIVISIDGLRPDAISSFGAQTLQRLMREGSYSLEARTILPSITLPSHTSMLTGVGPEGHGITWNDNRTDTHGTIDTPTIFALAHARGLRTAAFFSKGKFHHLLAPGTVDFAQAPAGNGRWFAGTTAENVEEYLEEQRPNLLFVHLGEPDYAGHVFGWMGTFYGWAVRRADDAVDRILDAAEAAFGAGNYTVLLTADHGGHGRTHGSSDPRDVTIPWIVWGDGVLPGRVLPPGIHTTDTAATALWLLGVEMPSTSMGNPVIAAFEAPSPTRTAEL